MSGGYDYLDGKPQGIPRSPKHEKSKSTPTNYPTEQAERLIARPVDYVCVACGKGKITHTKLKVCTRCYNRKLRNAGTGYAAYKLTDEQRADIVKRIKKFESPLALAKQYGVTTETILQVMKDSRKPS